jgi:hypothetical protein
LALLEQALLQATQNKATDPQTYEQARISYFTLLNGQSWLEGEKLRIAKDEVEPVLSEFSTKFNNLKGEQKMNSIFENLAGALKAQQASDEEDNGFLQKQLNSETDRVQTLNRLNQLNAPSGPPSTSYLPVILNIVMVILGLIVLYLLYAKSGNIMSYFSTSVETISNSISN